LKLQARYDARELIPAEALQDLEYGTRKHRYWFTKPTQLETSELAKISMKNRVYERPSMYCKVGYVFNTDSYRSHHGHGIN